MHDPAIIRIAEGLTKAQRRYMTTLTVYRDPTGFYGKRWMTFPPPNTHRVLMQLWLVDASGMLTTTGLAVRTYLQESEG